MTRRGLDEHTQFRLLVSVLVGGGVLTVICGPDAASASFVGGSATLWLVSEVVKRRRGK